jgi:hypothetical protein
MLRKSFPKDKKGLASIKRTGEPCPRWYKKPGKIERHPGCG